MVLREVSIALSPGIGLVLLLPPPLMYESHVSHRHSFINLPLREASNFFTRTFISFLDNNSFAMSIYMTKG